MYAGHEDTVSTLLGGGADVNDGGPLFTAAFKGGLEKDIGVTIRCNNRIIRDS
jgi:hypothetical protein